jgi:hypothetical protein
MAKSCADIVLQLGVRDAIDARRVARDVGEETIDPKVLLDHLVDAAGGLVSNARSLPMLSDFAV